MNSKDMFDDIQIASLESFLDAVPEHETIIIESTNVEDRKALTRIKNQLTKEANLIDYTYSPKKGTSPATGTFVVENKELVLMKLPINLVEQIK